MHADAAAKRMEKNQDIMHHPVGQGSSWCAVGNHLLAELYSDYPAY